MNSFKEVIVAKTNNKVKMLCKLKEKKYREEYGCYFVEGERMVKEAICLNQSVQTIFASQSFVKLKANFFDIVCDNTEVCVLSDDVFKYASDTVAPQGIIAVLKIPSKSVDSKGESAVILDGLQDAGNVGTIIRTMASVGIENVFMVDCVDVFNPKCVRSSMSGIYFVNAIKSTREQVKSFCTANNMPIVVADMNGEDIMNIKHMPNFALVIGNEGNGVSDFFAKNADKTISIKMKNVESLNAGVCASIMMYVLKNK